MTRDDLGVENAKHLRQPIVAVINGKSTRLLTIGYVAQTLGRTTWTIKNWTKLGLFPEAPYRLRSSDPRTLRRLYPESFVDALVAIPNRGYLGQRLDCENWDRFRDEVFRIFEMAVTPPK